MLFLLGGSRKSGEIKLSLAAILRFCTGSEGEPPLGFALQPTIEFSESEEPRAPTANTCSNRLVLSYPKNITDHGFDVEPVFRLFDTGFVSEYFGME